MPKVSEAHLEKRRQQILSATVVCVASNGLHNTTMADIAREAGVSDTLAYRYFSSKEELFEAAVRRYGDSDAELLLGIPGQADDIPALVDLLFSTNLRRFDHPDEMKSAMGMHFQSWGEALHDEEIRGEVVNRWEHHFDLTESVFKRAQTLGHISNEFDARVLGWLIIALHYGLNLLAVLDPEVDLEKCQDAMLKITFGGLEDDEDSNEP